MKLLVELLFLLLLVDGVEVLQGSASLQIVVNLMADLGQVLLDVWASVLELFLGELGDLSLHHALLVSEEAVGATEEALEGDDLLEEAKLRVGLFLRLSLNSLLDGRVDLLVDLSGGEALNAGLGSGLLEGRLDQRGDFLNMSLSIDSSSLDTF